MKKLVSMLLCALLMLCLTLSPAFAAGAVDEFVFTFRDGITWDSTLAEAMAAEGATDAREWGKNQAQINVYDVPFAGHASSLIYLFLDGKLVCISLVATDGSDNATALSDFKATLTEQYGQPNITELDRMLKIVTAVGGNIGDTASIDASPWAGWVLPDEHTLIFVSEVDGSVGLLFLNEAPFAPAKEAAAPVASFADAPAWLRVAGENENVLAASTDGTRFLMGEATRGTITGGIEPQLRVLNTLTKESYALYFADDPYLELLAHVLLGKAVPDEAKRAAIIEKNGGAAALVMRAGWQGWPAVTGAGGDFLLLMSVSMPCYARVDMRTGETLFLGASTACMAADGSVLFRDRDTGGIWLLRPDAHAPETFPLPAGPAFTYPSMHLLSDGSVWLIELVDREEQPKIEGKKLLMRDVSFVHYDTEGRELRRVEAGGFDLFAGAPDTLFYSEQTGVGVAYNPQHALYSPMWTFGEDDIEAKAFLPKSLTPPTLRRAERGEVVDEFGYPLSDVRMIIPLGVAADGSRLMLYDMDSAFLLALDLKTLEADALMTDEQLTALYDEINAQSRLTSHIPMLSWNGGDMLCGRANPGGYVLTIPYTVTFGAFSVLPAHP